MYYLFTYVLHMCALGKVRIQTQRKAEFISGRIYVRDKSSNKKVPVSHPVDFARFNWRFSDDVFGVNSGIQMRIYVRSDFSSYQIWEL